MKSVVKACPNCGHKGSGYRHGPIDYVAWHEWAEKMGRTHVQEPCPHCGRLTVWRRRK